MEARLKNNAWRQRQNILEAFIANGVPSGGGNGESLTTEEGDTLITEEGETVITE